MKKTLLFAVMIGISCLCLPGMFPGFYGARSLALGQSIFAGGWDVNAIYLNPAALAEAQVGLTAYQYQQAYRDYQGFEDSLLEAISMDLGSFSQLSPAQRGETVGALEELWSSRHGISGSTASLPAVVSRNFGFSISWVRSGRMHPVDTNAFDIPAESWDSDEIDSLRMRFTGLNYRQYSLAYALDLTRSMRLGVGLHYLTGKGTRFDAPLTGAPFSQEAGIRDLTSYAWEQAGNKFNRILADLSLVVSLGTNFQGVLVAKNIGKAKIGLDSENLELPQRLIAGLAFRPSGRMAIYLNMDLKATDLWQDGTDVQPISLAVEFALYQQRIFLRAGIWNDIEEKYFLGSRSNVQYGLGLGFRMSRVILDVGMALDSSGSVAGLAVGAAILVQ